MTFGRNILMCMLFSLGLLTRADTRLLHRDDPVREAITGALSELLCKIADGDEIGCKTLFEGDPEQAEFLRAQLAWVKSAEQASKALSAIVTDDKMLAPFQQSKVFRRRAEEMDRRIVILGGDRASVSPGGRQDFGAKLRLRGGKWIVTHLIVDDTMTKAQIQSVQAFTQIALAIEADAKAGKISSSQQLTDAVNSQAKSKSETLFPYRHPSMAPPPAGPPPKWDAPSPEKLAKLAGEATSIEAVEGLIASLPGLPCTFAYDNVLDVNDYDAGIAFTAHFSAKPNLGSFKLFAKGADGFAQYLGTLPNGLTFADRRADVERKLGRAPLSLSGGEQYTATYPTLGLWIDYQNDNKDGANPIHHIMIVKRDQGGDPPQPASDHPGRRVAFRLVATDASGPGADVEMLADPSAADQVKIPVLRKVLLDETSVARVYPTRTEADDRFVIGIQMTKDGAARLKEVTTANVGRRIAIVLDGKILIAPNVQAALAQDIVIDLGRSESFQAVDRAMRRLHAAVYALP